MRAIALLSVAAAMLVAACDFQPGDPVQHALRDAAAARHAAALKTTEEEAASARPSTTEDQSDELSRLITVRRQAIVTTRQLIAQTSNPELKAQLQNDLELEEGRLKALEARRTGG